MSCIYEQKGNFAQSIGQGCPVGRVSVFGSFFARLARRRTTWNVELFGSPGRPGESDFLIFFRAIFIQITCTTSQIFYGPYVTIELSFRNSDKGTKRLIGTKTSNTHKQVEIY